MLLIKNAEIDAYLDNRRIVDILIEEEKIIKIDSAIEEKGCVVVNANGNTVLPGLHDHHIHFMGLAAAQRSLLCGPPAVKTETELKKALQSAPGTGWIRGTHYHESVAGELNRTQLDQHIKNRPARIQDRSGIIWSLNSAAIEQLKLEQHKDLNGVELDTKGEITGRLFRMDAWLKERTSYLDPLPIKNTSHLLASYGVTGFTDTSAHNNDESFRFFSDAQQKGDLLQSVLLMGDPSLSPGKQSFIQTGHCKILLDEYKLPSLDQLIELIAQQHKKQRPVAIHCVTHTEMVFALTALKEAGHHPGDRIEHASVTRHDCFELLQQSQVTVVTQPNLLFERGEQYQKEVDNTDLDCLYRGTGFLQHDIPLALSTDAPYGSPDPWLSMQSAVSRKSSSGYLFNAEERLTPEQALLGFLSTAEEPGKTTRKLEAGAKANLCLLKQPWDKCRQHLHKQLVTHTIINGKVAFQQT